MFKIKPGAHLSFHSVGIKVIFVVIKIPGHETEHSSLFSVEVRMRGAISPLSSMPS